MLPFESLRAVSYSYPIVTMALLCMISEIMEDIDRESRLFSYLLHSTTPCKYCHNVSYGESRKTKERTVLSEFTSEVRDTTCQWDHTMLSATDRGDRRSPLSVADNIV